MLNITDNRIHSDIKIKEFKSFSLLKKNKTKRLPLYLLIAIILSFMLSLFLPWTQNISAKGYVTTRSPEERPQSIQSVIDGRIEKWYVQEGDYVQAGDTIAFLSEVKSEYFDPQLLDRTEEQLLAKQQSIISYEQKVQALERQQGLLNQSLALKLQQLENKIVQARNKMSIDSIDLIAYENNLAIAQNQEDRTQQLYDKGLKSLSELQEKQYKQQELSAKLAGQRNKLLNQKRELENYMIERSGVAADYANKLAKSVSDMQSATSQKQESIAASSKLANKLSTYSERQKHYYVRAPQSGYITKTLKKGIGEIVKSSSSLATIMPKDYELAVEMYLRPQDIPLLNIGNEVRMRFDGWPAIVISGWPATSTGLFTAKVVAIDQFISDNGYYRVIVSPDNEQKAWPKELRVGTGAKAFVLLNEVALGYELWRQLNGFPPDFYKKDADKKEEVKRKAPIKSVK